jgi:UPF0716 protein FxsA
MPFLLLLAFPLVELYVLVKAGAVIGALNTVLWELASAALGIWAVRAQGQGAMRTVRAELAQGRIPQNPFLDGLLIFLGGILLILPGLLSDALGLLLLIPPVRRLAAIALAKRLAARQAGTGDGGVASRVVFFRSSGFSGPGGPFPPGSGPPGPFSRPDSVSGHPEQDARTAYDDMAPRQATVLESSAMEFSGEEEERGEERRTPPDGGEAGVRGGFGSSGATGAGDGR